MLRGRRIVIGVTGGIACYKTCELVRLCVKAGAEVKVVMTEHATEFVAPLTFETLSGHDVVVGMYGRNRAMSTEHIAMARWAEIIVIAPATANILAKAAHGIADDFLSTMIIATYSPVMFVPAMNTAMLKAPATQRNIPLLLESGYHITPTGKGELADGEVGEGRMIEPREIMHHLVRALPRSGILAGKRVLVTAGPTEEPVDPVRVFTNRSSGRMGVALAEIAAGMGAHVTFVHGPLAVPQPIGADSMAVGTAQQMMDAVLTRFPETNVLVMAAAVADYRPKTVADQKIKKTTDTLTIEMERTPDILASVARKKKPGQIVVGFAVETEAEKADKRALERLQKKSLDMIALNVIGEKGVGFGTDTNRVTLFCRDGSKTELPLMEKREIARIMWERIAALPGTGSQAKNEA